MEFYGILSQSNAIPVNCQGKVTILWVKDANVLIINRIMKEYARPVQEILPGTIYKKDVVPA